MIEIKNITKKYGNNIALNNISFNVNDGEIFAFIGHNGAGKTTLIKSIVGIHEFDEGDILINGKSIKEKPVESKKDMAFVPDNPELYVQMKAINFINFICDMYEVPQNIRENNIKKYARLFEIENNLDDTIESFSHGMKQKIALISALAHEPKILIMDEPFIGMALTGITIILLVMAVNAKLNNNIIILIFTSLFAIIYAMLSWVLHKICDKSFNNISV